MINCAKCQVPNPDNSTVCAACGTALAGQSFAQALYEADVPFPEGTEEYDMYKVALEDQAIPLEDQAVAYYEKTIAKAGEEKVVNQWTKRILEELNKYKPSDYPLFHEEIRKFQPELTTSLPPLTPASLVRAKAPEANEDK